MKSKENLRPTEIKKQTNFYLKIKKHTSIHTLIQRNKALHKGRGEFENQNSKAPPIGEDLDFKDFRDLSFPNFVMVNLNKEEKADRFITFK